MLSSRKSLAAVAAVTAAVAVAVPAASVSAAPTVDPTVCQLVNAPMEGAYAPTQFFGGASLVNVLNNAGGTVGCAAAAPAAAPGFAMPF